MKRPFLALVVCLAVTGLSSDVSGQQNATQARPVNDEVSNDLPTGPFRYPTINLSGKEYFLLERDKYTSFLTGLNDEPGSSGGAPGSTRGEAGSSAGGAGGAGAAQAVDPSMPLAQIQLQNYFKPQTYGATGYANSFVVQPVIPIHLDSEFLPYHIIRPTLPLIGGPDEVKGGIGNLSMVDIFVHPIKELKTNVGAGYALITPTATDPDLGPREWYVGPAVFAITTSVDKWVIGALVQTPISLESNKYTVQMQPIVTRLLEGQWYVGWGDTLLTLNDQDGHYNIPLQVRVGKVVMFGKQPVNIFLQGEYTPRGFQSGGQEQWAIKISITPLLAGMKLGPISGCKDE